jgi:hypothetical protein
MWQLTPNKGYLMKLLILSLLVFSIYGCKKAESDANYSVDSTGESAQQIGDAMAAVDESGGTTNGNVTSYEVPSYEKAFARMTQNEFSNSPALVQLIFPLAHAADCNTISFSTCSSSQRIRTMNCSTAGGGNLSGSITLSYSGTGAASCTIPSASDAVSRLPSYTITGLRGATFSVSATSSGQTLTRSGATTFNFSNSGIRRTFVTPKGTTLLDITTSTSSPIVVTGNNRNTRSMSGGSLVVANNLNGVSCSLSPSSVAWTASCNCPTSGSWSGSCSDSSTFSVAFNSTCGQATVTKDGTSSTVTMDRCQ